MSKILQLLSLLLLIGFLLGFIILQYFTTFQSGFSESFIYWWILVAWIFIIRKFRVKSLTSLISAIILLVLAILIFMIGFPSLGEKVARFSFIGLIVGFIQALKDYQNH